MIDKVLFVLFLALLIWLPIPLGSNREWALAIAVFLAVVITTAWLVAYLADRVSPRRAVRKARWFWLVWLLWLAYGILQWLPMPGWLVSVLSPHAHAIWSAVLDEGWMTLSLAPQASREMTVLSIFLMLLCLMTLQFLNTASRIRVFVSVIMISAVLQALFGATMTLTGLEYSFFVQKWNNVGLATGTFVNRNHFANYIALCAGLGFGVLIGSLKDDAGEQNTRARIRNTLRWLLSPGMRIRIYLIIIVIALVMTRSRMGNIAFMLAIMAGASLGLWAFRSSVKKISLVLVSILIVDILIISSWFGFSQLVERIESSVVVTEQQGGLHSDDRIHVNAQTLDLIRDYPLAGSGGGSYLSVFPQYRIPQISGFYDHAHNDYLEFLANYGVIGGFILLTMLVISVARAVRRLHSGWPRALRGVVLGALTGLTVMLIHATVDFSLHIPANAALFCCLLALCWINPRRSRSSARDL